MESKMISRECIKPSSPTPAHLRTYKVSMLDQTSMAGHIPLVFFFPPRPDNNVDDRHRTTEQLKHSLSIILTRFYPFAGRFNGDNHSIDCSDAGVDFTVFEFPGHSLLDLLRDKDSTKDLPAQLLPIKFAWVNEKDPESRVVFVQVNYFECGAVAIATLISHWVADLTTMVNFLKAWAGTNRGSNQEVCPNYISQILFPHKTELLGQQVTYSGFAQTGKWAMRRYVFDSIAISSLKAKTGLENPTRVEAVSAFLWNCFMAASLKNGKSASAMAIAMNLRGRAKPPFGTDFFGNCGVTTTASSQNCMQEDVYKDLARKLRDAVARIDGEFVARMQGDRGLLGYHANRQSLVADFSGGADRLVSSSWCGFGVYDVDFGWGKPVWVTTAVDSSSSTYANSIILMDTSVGNGVEALIRLGEKYMAVFDAIEELLDLACIDPSPLGIGSSLN
ncbi:stemmadenine O-acetyltransferase-like [Andrographis paniculata]|uniref:stemmadenine O-acetyltransferase-like n=1 Tax=Andrographis paniculata TaxID=175694 RepID=UPI0021E7CEA9|nr:stemmadenine O-acetyltransferase-like [Andrographis paniculata]